MNFYLSFSLIITLAATTGWSASSPDTETGSEFRRAFLSQTAAEEEEEAGQYQQAAMHFAEAVKFYKMDDIYSNFYADLGRLRCLRRLGQEQDWKDGCNAWHSRLRGLRRRILTRPLEKVFDGRNLVEADWDMSCGDFSRGLDLVEREIRRRTLNPLGHFYGIPPDYRRAKAPYMVLNREFRALGRGDLGEEASQTGQRSERAETSSDLQDILNSALDLIRRCRAAAKTK